MIRNIVFDIGNVLADFCWEEYFNSFGFSEDTIKRIVKATVMSGVWDEFDRGAKSDEEILNAFIAEDPGIEKEIRLLFENVHDIVKKYDDSIPWIESLKEKGYKVYYLSNFAEKTARECADSLDFIPHTDGGILSYTVKLIKPMPEFYKMLLSKYDLDPEECVFIDDREVNCEGAIKAGMKAIVYKSREQAKKELALLGV